MKRVMKHGWAYVDIVSFACETCGCEFTAERQDLEIELNRQIHKGAYQVCACKYSCTCPECGSWKTLYKTKP